MRASKKKSSRLCRHKRYSTTTLWMDGGREWNEIKRWRMTEMEQQMKGTVVGRQRGRDNDGDGRKTREEGRKFEGEKVEQREGLKGPRQGGMGEGKRWEVRDEEKKLV